MARRVSTQKIKSNRSYTVEEAAEVLNITEQTVRVWIKSGLPVLRAKRPMLVLGFELRAFLQDRTINAKQPTVLGEIYCVRCNKPQKPFGMMADYIPVDATNGRLVTLCGVCEGTCSQFASKTKLAELSLVLEIVIGSPGKPIGTFQSPPKS